MPLRRAHVLVVCPLALLLCAWPRAVRGQAADEVARADQPPRIDGVLDDPVWRRGPFSGGFKSADASKGRPPGQRSDVRIAYDSTNIYVAINAFDARPDSIRAGATSPAAAFADDWVTFAIDPHGDGLEAAFFLVSAGNVGVAGDMDGTGQATPTTDLRWSHSVRRTAEGYTVEMAIPLAQLPFAGTDSVPMAFRAIRLVSRTGEESDYPGADSVTRSHTSMRRILLRRVHRSSLPEYRALFDVRAAYREKQRLIAELGDTTLATRTQAYGDASVLDYLIFPARDLVPSRTPFLFAQHPEQDDVARRLREVRYAPGHTIGELDRFLERTGTTSFIVIRSDTVVYEKYFNGWRRDSIFTSFSVAKAFVSTLVGIAIDRGLIHSVDDPVTRYLPELARRDPRFERITVGDLLRMSSGLRYVEGAPPHDDERTYMDPDLRRAALESTLIVEDPGHHWLYNNYNPLLLGMILERVSGGSVTALLQTALWNPVGMEFGGSWSLDSRASGFEKMESGINARAIDFAKLGELYLHHGTWRGQRVVSEKWIQSATQPWPAPAGYYGDGTFFNAAGHYFGYFWWGDRRDGGESDYHTVGNKGQYVYCSPQRHVVIVRTGTQYGMASTTWIRLFRELADSL